MQREIMGRNKKKSITPKIFHKLWDAACKSPDRSEYVRDILRSGRFRPESCDLKYDEAVTLLLDIHRLSTTSFKDILGKIKKRKCEISDLYCIPIRTVEEWYSGGNKCPGYVRLMIMRDFGILDLGVDIKEKKKEEKRENPKIKEAESIRSLLERTSYLIRQQ